MFVSTISIPVAREGRSRTASSLPSYGRFLEPDPIGYEDSPNLYAYVGTDPVNFIDPLGLCDADANGNLSPSFPGENCGDIVVTAKRTKKTSEQPLVVMIWGYLNSVVGGGPARTTPRQQPPEEKKPGCTGEKNVNASIDAGVFLGYGGGFTLGLSYDAERGSLTAYASVRAGKGVGWIAGGGVGATSSGPSQGYSRSTNLAVGAGSYGGSVSSSSGKTSISGGVSAGPKVGFEYSKTENLTETKTLISQSGSQQCQ